MLSLPLVSQFPLGLSLCHGRLLCPGGLLSRLLRPGGLQSRLLRPGGLRSRLLRPGGLWSRLPHMDLALRLLPRFHLRSTALLDCSMCGASGSRSLGGGGALSRIWFMNELTPTHHIVSCTSLQLHITHGLHFPSTIALVTQLSPITHCLHPVPGLITCTGVPHSLPYLSSLHTHTF